MSSIIGSLLFLPGILVALTFHEYAHGWVANRLGDPTARLQGRLTLNPIPHLDPIGFIMLLFFQFGWAKPVPVNPYNLQVDRRQGMLYVSAAGPVMNILLAVLLAVIYRIAMFVAGASVYMAGYGDYLWIIFAMLEGAVFINIVLAVFNLIPIPPLDGSKILAGILPGRSTVFYYLENYGFIILIVLLLTGIIGGILGVVIHPIADLLLPQTRLLF